MTDIKSSSLFTFTIKNIKFLTIICLSGGILATIFSSSFFIQPKFKSTAIVYPSNLGSYSEESPIEQMMQWFESIEIKNKVITENDLAKHYDISTEDKLYSYNILEEYNENILITKTKYESAEISVLDTDPKKAYEIVISIIDNFNKVIRKVHKKRALEDLNTEQQKLRELSLEIDSVSKELQNLRENYGLIDYATQAKEVTRGYLKTIEGSNKSNINIQEIFKLKENIEEKGGDFIVYNTTIYKLLSAFAKVHEGYSWAMSNFNRKMTYTNIVSQPQVPVKKSYPIRWLIIVISVLGSFFFTFVLLLFYNKIKQQ